MSYFQNNKEVTMKQIKKRRTIEERDESSKNEKMKLISTLTPRQLEALMAN